MVTIEWLHEQAHIAQAAADAGDLPGAGRMQRKLTDALVQGWVQYTHDAAFWHVSQDLANLQSQVQATPSPQGSLLDDQLALW